MPRAIVEDNSHIVLRVCADDKATLMRAAALAHTGMTEFILRHALDAARKVIQEAERAALSARDSLRVLEALENPRKPDAKLLSVARCMPRRTGS